LKALEGAKREAGLSDRVHGTPEKKVGGASLEINIKPPTKKTMILASIWEELTQLRTHVESSKKKKMLRVH